MIEKLTSMASAIEFKGLLNPIVTSKDYGVGDIANSIVNILFFAAGIAAVIYLIWSGFLYITAAGNEKNAEQGQKGITWSIIGIIIITAAYIIVRAVSNTGEEFLK